MKDNRTQFATRLGVIATTVGSAVGLGNIWRFPYEAGVHGGGAFLLIDLFFIFIIGVPVVCAEFIIGRHTGSNIRGAFRALAPGKAWGWVSYIGLAASVLILSFYSVVAGWTMHYTIKSATGFSGLTTADALHDQFDAFASSDLLPVIWTLVFLAVNYFILSRGVQKGIERLSNVMMPMLFIILVAMCVLALSLPGAADGVAYFLNPDFSKIDASVVVNALGQAFFSLSLGMGILVTYASYYPADTKLGKTAITVALLSVGVAILMGLVIFPAVKSFGLDNENLRGATLVFVTLPEVFAQLPLPQLWAAMFFFLLLVAALTSTVSIAEVSIAMFQDRCHMSRRAATFTVMLPLFVLSAICSLSMGSWARYTIFGMNFFDLLDSFTTNWLLPIVAFGTCIYMGWFAPNGLLRTELSNGAPAANSTPVQKTVLFIIRYLAPVLIVAIVVFSL